MKEKEITPHDILQWVMDNKDNQSDIDMVSHMIFPYTTKYKNMQPHRYPQDDNFEIHT